MNPAAVTPIALLVLPVIAGLVGTLLPAFGHLPAIGAVGPSLAPWRALMAEPGLARSAGLSLASGLIAPAIAFALVIGFLASWADTPVFRRATRLISPLLSVPHAAAAFGLAFLIAPSGWIVRLMSPWATGYAQPPDALIVNDGLGLALIAGLVVKETPFLFLVALAAMGTIDAVRSREIGQSLGYGRVASFLYGVLPRLYPAIRLPVYAVIAYAAATVDVAMILGPTTPPTLAVRIVGWITDPDLSKRLLAAAGALLQLALTALAIGLWRAGETIVARLGTAAARSGRRWSQDRAVRVGFGAAMGLSIAAVSLGMAGLALWSVAGPWPFPQALPQSLTLAPWRRAAAGLAEPLMATVAIGGVVTAVALMLVIALLAAGRRGGDRLAGLLFLALIVPEIAFLFGLDVLALQLGIGPGWIAVMIGHSVFVAPYVFLSLSGPWASFDRRYEQAALSLGASPAGVLFRVRLPMLARPIATAAAVGFAVSAALYLPTAVLGGGRIATITTETVALAAGGDRRTIGVSAIVQAALPFAGFALAALIPAWMQRNRRGLRGRR